MDTIKRTNVPQRRIEDWEEVLLYDELRRGPETSDAWCKTLKKLYLYLRKKDNRSRLARQLLTGETEESWAEERLDRYLDDATDACRKIINYTKTPTPNPDYWQQDLLREVGQHVHEILAQQDRKERSTEELFQDFLNAGTVEPHPTRPDVAYFVTDHHGQKLLLPKSLLPESLNWPLDKILADPDPGEGRPFKSDDCVRLMTDEYMIHGMPKGIEGYVSGVVSNKFLGWEANRCHVMVILSCQDNTKVWQDFLEVQEDQLQLCNKKHPPSLWFPFEVARNGQVIRDPESGRFKRHKKSTPYTYQDLWDALTEQPREIPRHEKKKNLFQHRLRNVLQEIRKKIKVYSST